MEVLQRAEKNRIENEIRNIKSYITLDSNAIERLKQQTTNLDYNKKQIRKLKGKNVERDMRLRDLERRLFLLERGLLDDELEEEHQKTKTEISRKEDIAKKRKLQIKKDEDERKEKSKEYYNTIKAGNRQQRTNNYIMDAEYHKYMRALNSIPEYIKEKLKKMPYNRGFIWKGIHLYGERDPEVGRPVVLTEKKRNNLCVIHEWTDTKHYTWYKYGNSRKVLQSVEDWKRIPTNFDSLLDFVK
jgi:hypothetical protein